MRILCIKIGNILVLHSNQSTQELPDDLDSSSSQVEDLHEPTALVPDDHDDDDDDDQDEDTNLPRRSTRTRKKPQWIEHYACCLQTPQNPEWKDNALCFQEMAFQLRMMDKEMSNIFLKVFTEKF
jgi:hypothetical protein